MSAGAAGSRTGPLMALFTEPLSLQKKPAKKPVRTQAPTGLQSLCFCCAECSMSSTRPGVSTWPLLPIDCCLPWYDRLLLFCMSLADLCVQAANAALKASINSTQQERTQLSEMLRQLQDDFVQASCSLSAEAQTLSAQANRLSGGMLVLSHLQDVSTDAVKAKAAQAVQQVVQGAAGHAADCEGVAHTASIHDL
jgi:hypothetical protein